MTLSACSTPSHNQVRIGSDPYHEDDSVAFRTTYYFRVFDYCAVKRTADGRRILVPKIDSLYRFRMTGKGSTLLQNVKFESGTLRSHEIDPFGARIVRDSNTGQLRFQSQRETEESFEQEANFAKFTRLLRLYESLQEKIDKTPGSIPQSTLDVLQTSMEKSLQAYSGAIAAKVDRAPRYRVSNISANTDETSEINQITFDLEMLHPYRGTYSVDMSYDENGNVRSFNIGEGTSHVGGQAILPSLNLVPIPSSFAPESSAPPTFIIHFRGNFEAVTRLHVHQMSPADVEASESGNMTTVSVGATDVLDTGPYAHTDTQNTFQIMARAQPDEIQCPEGAPTRQGFQILGPEGWRTFNQDERLVMAMTTDSQPLISTLKGISSRALNAQSSPSNVLLPISEARRKLGDAQQVLDGALLREEPELLEVAKEMTDALRSE